jgi:large subunit ribosomal protein L16
MKLFPKKTKYKKSQKGRAFNRIKVSKTIFNYGQCGLKAITSGRINSKQLITLYNSLKKKMKKKGKVIIRIFPQTPISKKPNEVRMGKGKGNVSFWVAKVCAGTVLCEISTPHKLFANKVLNDARFKISLKTKVLKRVY